MKATRHTLHLAPLLLALCSCDEPGQRNPEMRQAVLQKFDKDGDGKLNESERAEARSAREKRGGGEKMNRLSPEQRKRLIFAFDKDGDGQLNEEERAAARQAIQKRRKAQEP